MLLLIGLYILQVVIVLVIPFLPIEDMKVKMIFLSNASWIGNMLFGIVIFWLTRSRGLVAVPVGLLSIVLPTYGSILYILTALQNKLKE